MDYNEPATCANKIQVMGLWTIRRSHYWLQVHFRELRCCQMIVSGASSFTLHTDPFIQSLTVIGQSRLQKEAPGIKNLVLCLHLLTCCYRSLVQGGFCLYSEESSPVMVA